MREITRRNFLLFSLLAIIGLQISDRTWALTPHRAYYKISLHSSEPNSEVIGAQGRMVLEVADNCDGWAIKQKSDTLLSLKTSSDQLLSLYYTAWESKQGDQLHFYVSRAYNGVLFEDVIGEANFDLNGNKGRANFYGPEPLSFEVKSGTIPPVKHLISLLKAAQAGQEMLSNDVFDGSAVGQSVHINTFIAPKKKQCNKGDNIKGLKGAVYPMQLAIYASSSHEALPNFEMKQNFYNNGVMCSYTINFGDYKVQGTLDRLEYTPRLQCSKINS